MRKNNNPYQDYDTNRAYEMGFAEGVKEGIRQYPKELFDLKMRIETLRTRGICISCMKEMDLTNNKELLNEK